MSEKYNEYIEQHKQMVGEAFDWLVANIPELFVDDNFKSECEWQCKNEHDQSKYTSEEYDAYDAYFYGGNRSYDTVREFNKAWLHHQHNNRHHWQYWVLLNDNPDEGEIILDMPDIYIIEMICDWLSFSIAKGYMKEINEWYKEHKDYIKLSEDTREKVEDIIDKINAKLTKSDGYNG